MDGMETMNRQRKRIFFSKNATMKTKHLFFAAALSLLAACQVELQDNNLLETVENDKEQEEKVVPPEITASQEVNNPTKSILEVDETGHGNIYWTPYDEINVFYGTTSTHYVSKNTENAATAVFKTSDVIGISETASENIWGLYPYNENATCTGSAVNTTLPATQYGVPGTFDDDLFITLAHNTSTALVFYNVCGGIKFSLSRDDITSITFRGNNNEDIAGDISLAFSDGLPSVNVTSGIKVITLTPKTGSTFVGGENYYFTMLPVTLSGGFTMVFETTSGIPGIFNYSDNSVTIKRSKFSKKEEIDTYATFSIPYNQIWYTSSDGEIVPIDITQDSEFSGSVISNVYSDGRGVITFDNDINLLPAKAFKRPNNISSSTLTSVILPESITSIGSSAFSGCANLLDVNLPKGIESMGFSVFSHCLALQSVNLPMGLTTIDNSMFYDCFGLTQIDIPENVTRIADEAFYQCSALSSIIIPGNVTYIGSRAFRSCSSLNSITFLSTVPPQLANEDAFMYTTCPIFVPGNSLEAYKNALHWKNVEEGRILATPEAVDLGLSVKWASWNLGASVPEEYGDYFAWDETETKDNYSWETYKWSNEDSNKFTKYCPTNKTNYWDGTGSPDGKTVLDLEDDASRANWGGTWRMPTDAEWTELRNNCTWTWTTQNGVNGRLVTSNINGNNIFLPAAGHRLLSNLFGAGSDGDYWSSSLNTDYPAYAWSVYFNSNNVYRDFGSRGSGQSVRPVCE